MRRFTTNRTIQDTIYTKKKETTIEEPIMSKEILRKIELIKKAFR